MKIIKPLIYSGIKLKLVFIILIFPQLNLLAQKKHSIDSLTKLSFEDLMNIPITTASAFEEDRKKILKAGCDDFISKPFHESKNLK